MSRSIITHTSGNIRQTEKFKSNKSVRRENYQFS